MRLLTVCGIITALSAIAVSAPLFHVHEGEHGGFIHAHLPELENPAVENVVHMEAPHAGGEGRSIDLFIAMAPHFVHFDAAIIVSELTYGRVTACCGFARIAVPRAHAPPGLSLAIPRSPPA